jgi:hypothetical protein
LVPLVDEGDFYETQLSFHEGHLLQAGPDGVLWSIDATSHAAQCLGRFDGVWLDSYWTEGPVVEGMRVFAADTGGGPMLWATDGAQETTYQLSSGPLTRPDTPPDDVPQVLETGLRRVEDQVYFLATAPDEQRASVDQTWGVFVADEVASRVDGDDPSADEPASDAEDASVALACPGAG